MRDGQAWHVPLLRTLDGQTALPRVHTFADGRRVRQTAPEHLAIMATAERFFTAFLAACGGEDPAPNDEPIDENEVVDMAGAVLALNYLLSAADTLAYGLLDESRATEVMIAAVDGATMRAAMEAMATKKKA
ncbi:MAG: hypothetical protein GTO03_17060 [Planctomycetales bacterium]|nr:hypothetical protein [Planctomycetales bacterium]